MCHEVAAFLEDGAPRDGWESRDDDPEGLTASVCVDCYYFLDVGRGLPGEGWGKEEGQGGGVHPTFRGKYLLGIYDILAGDPKIGGKRSEVRLVRCSIGKN